MSAVLVSQQLEHSSTSTRRLTLPTAPSPVTTHCGSSVSSSYNAA